MIPINMALSPPGEFYTSPVKRRCTGSIEAFTVTKGALTVIAGHPSSPGIILTGWPSTPAGRFLYTANTLDNSISEFTDQCRRIADAGRIPRSGDQYRARRAC